MSTATATRSALDLLAECDRLGVVLAVEGDRLTVDAPRHILASPFIDDLRESKADLIALLKSRQPTPPVIDGIDVPVNWRWRVACWPSSRWNAWHRLVDKLRQHGATVVEIEAAELVAYDQVRNQGEQAR